MKKKLQSALAVGLFLGFIVVAQADYSPVVNDDGSVVIAEFSTPKVWKLRGKGKSNPKINFDTKTPQGKAAITFETQGSGEAVVSTGSITPGGEWRTKEYNKVSFMIKNNGDKGLVLLRFFVYAGGNYNILVRFPSKDKGWQKKIIDLGQYIKKGFVPADIKLFRIRTFDKTNISLGPVMFVPEKGSKEAGAQKNEEKVKKE
jgi:hypothetical protein